VVGTSLFVLPPIYKSWNVIDVYEWSGSLFMVISFRLQVREKKSFLINLRQGSPPCVDPKENLTFMLHFNTGIVILFRNGCISPKENNKGKVNVKILLISKRKISLG
jgi:hypothetical protein